MGRFHLVASTDCGWQHAARAAPAYPGRSAAASTDDFASLLVSQDRGGDRVVAPFFEKLGLARLKTTLDPQRTVGRAFTVRGLPTSILIDREGNVLGSVEGALNWDAAPAQALLRWYIARGPKPSDDVVKTSAER